MFITILLAMLINPVLSSNYTIKIKHETTVLGQKIYLRDLTYKDIKPSLSVIQLATSPLPGHYKYLYREEIKRKLTKSGVKNIKQFKIPQKIKVIRAGKNIDKTIIMNQILQVLKKIIPEAVFTSIYVGRSSFIAPLGELQFTAKARDFKAESGNWSGKIIVSVGAEKVLEIPVSARFSIYRKLPVAAENLISGTVLKSSLIKYRKIDVTKYHNLITTPSILSGGKLLRNMKEGEPFVKYSIKPKTVVKRRRRVTIVVKMGNIRAKAYGIAMQNGALGEMIKVKNVRSGKIVKGIVTATGEVTVGRFR